MKIIKSLGLTGLLVSSGLVALAACGSDDDDTTPPTVDSGADVTAGDSGIPLTDGSDSGEILSDGQIYQVLREGNLGEIAEAKLAETQATTSVIQNIASEFDTDHTSADTALVAAASADGIVAAESPDSIAIESSLVTDEQEYQSLNGSSFDATYLTNQINAHATLLAFINDKALPQVKDAGLKAQVQAAQAMVSMHLSQLEAIEADGGFDAGFDDGGGLHHFDGGTPDGGDVVDAADAGDAD